MSTGCFYVDYAHCRCGTCDACTIREGHKTDEKIELVKKRISSAVFKFMAREKQKNKAGPK